MSRDVASLVLAVLHFCLEQDSLLLLVLVLAVGAHVPSCFFASVINNYVTAKIQ